MLQVATTTPATPAAPQTRVRQTKNAKYANDGSYDSVKHLIKKLAWLYWQRVEKLGGLCMTMGDVEAMLNLTYVQAHAKWNPNGESRFATYFTFCCQNNFNNAIRKPETERVVLAMVNFTDLTPVGGGDHDDGNDDPTTFMDVAGSTLHPDEILQRQQEMRERLMGLSLNARRLVSALMAQELSPVDPALKPTMPKLSRLVKDLGIGGDELARLKHELLASFDVTF